MYKSLLAASLTAIVAYLFASSSLLTDSLLQLSVDSFKSKRAYTTMSESTTSVSRTVTKKVFAVEQNEVRVCWLRKVKFSTECMRIAGCGSSSPEIHWINEPAQSHTFSYARPFPCWQRSGTIEYSFSRGMTYKWHRASRITPIVDKLL